MFIYSTLASSIAYKIGNREVIIIGGANITNKNLVTPKGIATKVSKEDLEELCKIESFRKKERNGFFATSLIERNADKMARDMNDGDKSAQKDLSKVENTSKAKKRK